MKQCWAAGVEDRWDINKLKETSQQFALGSAGTRVLHRARASTAMCLGECLETRAYVRLRQKGDGLKDDRRLQQKSNHLIATFFISIFCFMAAEGRRATPAVIHGRSGGR